MSATRRPVAWAPVVWALVAPLLVRAALLVDEGASPGLDDLRGLLSDLVVALAVGAVLALAGRRRLPAVVLLAIWSLLHYATYEHVRELGSGLQFRFARFLVDRTFLLGFALAPSRPLLLATLVVGIPALYGWWTGRRRVESSRLGERPRVAPLLVASLAGTVALALPLSDPSSPIWRRAHFVHENLYHLAAGTLPSRRPGPGPVPAAFGADLSGEARVELDHPGTNLLLVVLEGVPASALRQVARTGVAREPAVMPRLSDLADRGLAFTHFVTHQRQTNRGMYSLLCGDYPKLAPGLAKSTEQVRGRDRLCLPRLLARHGYRTVYLQGAPLAFMYKDAFMPLAGFEEVYGDRDFASAVARTAWGVDDRTLFRRGHELVTELQAGGRPWLLTLLTVGTHPPYVVPGDLPTGARAAWAAAASYLDEALGEFFDGLESAGLLRETLVIVTSDESRGFPSRHRVVARVSSNWSPLVALLPTGERGEVGEPYGASDLALSLVDYLGLDVGESQFVGRSLFRRYAEPRTVYFSNVHRRVTGALDGRGSLHLCNERLSRCAKYPVGPEAMFRPRGPAAAPEAAELEALRATVAHSLGEGAADRGPRFELVGDRRVALSGVPGQLVMGGQNLSLPAGSRAEVEILLRLSGPAGKVRLSHELRQRRVGEHLRRELPPLAVGERLRVRYAFEHGAAIDNLSCSLWVSERSGSDLELHVDAARLTVRKASDGPSDPGLRLLGEPEIAVEPAAL